MVRDMRRHLLMQLRAPLVSFGGEAIDNYGVIRDFPALSMVTGLIGNALGWERGDFGLLDRLQARLVLGTRIVDGEKIVDFQTAQLAASDTHWTTLGVPESRRGGEDSYRSPHLRYRDYHTKLDALIALRLEPAAEAPTLDDIAHALDRPQRPLFIGRKPCLPSARLLAGFIEADDVLDALQRASASDKPKPAYRFQWPDGEGTLEQARALDVCDERNWKSGVHGGWRRVLEGTGALRSPASLNSTLQEPHA
jgi:CRISPR system Cascade subunit CasD